MEDSATKLRLQWRDHGNELSKLSREMFGNDDLTDVTLTCRGGNPYHAHKMVLAAASTYFRKFFKEIQCKMPQHQVIFMKDVDPSEMEYLLQFIYLGEVDIPSTDLERLITISRELGIVGLNAVKSEKENTQEETSERRMPKVAKRIRKPPTIKEVPTPKRPRVKADPEPIYQQEVIKVNQVDPEPIYEEEQDVQEEPEENQDFIDDYIDADGDYGGENEDEEADEEDENVEDANGAEEEVVISMVNKTKTEEFKEANKVQAQTIPQQKMDRRKQELEENNSLIGSVAKTMEGRNSSQHGRSTLYIIGDYLYSKGKLHNRKDGSKVLNLQCRSYLQLCKARVLIDPGTHEVLKFNWSHSCTKDPDLISHIQMENEMKYLAETTKDNLKDIFKQVCLQNPIIGKRIEYHRLSGSLKKRRQNAMQVGHL